MEKLVLGNCPLCNGKLKVKKLQCENCDIVIEGDFGLDNFCYLSKEQKQFVEIFIKLRGNIKEVGKEIGISYPTVKSKLDDVIMALGYEEYTSKDYPKDEIYESEKEILQKLDLGIISAEEALHYLQKKGE